MASATVQPLAASLRIPRFPLLMGAASVFLANLALLVLQLVAPRMLAPAIGSSLETWTTIIGVFLAGIALGNFLGGRMADRGVGMGRLSVLLLVGAAATLVPLGGAELIRQSPFYQSIPLGARIPLLSAMVCLIPATVLSLVTPVAIRVCLTKVEATGRVAGLMFAVSTLGCLLGNYLTGFTLMAKFTTDTITIGTAVLLALAGIGVRFAARNDDSDSMPNLISSERIRAEAPVEQTGFKLRTAYLTVFIASFCGMSLELAGFRVLAPYLGVSLWTWTGIIGVMLAGTASGNFIGGVVADRGVMAGGRTMAFLAFGFLGAMLAPMLLRGILGLFLAQFSPESLRGMTPATLYDRWDTEWARELGRYSLTWTVRSLGFLIGLGWFAFGIWLSVAKGGWFMWGALTGSLLGPSVGGLLATYYPETIPANRWVRVVIGGQLGLIGMGGLRLLVQLMQPMFEDSPEKRRRYVLGGTLMLGGLFVLLSIVLTILFMHSETLEGLSIVDRVMAWTFGLFFLPMMWLGMVSPQVIRLSVPDVSHAGRITGSIYAVSTLGAIAGTFATGYVLISSVGTFPLLLILACSLAILAIIIGQMLQNAVMLFGVGLMSGALTAGIVTLQSTVLPHYDLETNYYAIRVTETDPTEEGIIERELILDMLIHSKVRYQKETITLPNGQTEDRLTRDPQYLYYAHEEIQGELVRAAIAKRNGKPSPVLVIGGGGYTFPYYCEMVLPGQVDMEVVEIDPGVTEIAYDKLLLPRDTKIISHNMDGRQFIAERAPKGHYDLIMQDAVNDLSVPYHLMTQEYNDHLKSVLQDDGVYLLSIIDSLENGLLWRASVNTLRKTFPHVTVLGIDSDWDTADRSVYVIYASNQPLDMEKIQQIAKANGNDEAWTHMIPAEKLESLLQNRPAPVLTDRYAPVDNLMAEVFRARAENR
ncbi:fused MFS/spermidine synthase [Tuwongella immobilis]|uniref:PABS domain-containing protein n=1 Tax=Tuwongella immobilis TaxID=692036 RepID=A0A6C2YGW1_9BACT|nr:fused MFS/spermidine synthase [Tuwongella immobilis]VIP00748.1 Putative membrane protein OS=Myxococcus xanthus (strain DK 1622) GN=MXAN_2295 PE=4 SV=1: Spermine_synth [Tuwongella immobilis]VTR96914.1 Putative membrane protein OS=Myxococcus xanthus (strain DK 1622) GN=MXAN_2295 PE=4 SV=1: Spermine_synth [Tuwongella immobilis]